MEPSGTSYRNQCTIYKGSDGKGVSFSKIMLLWISTTKNAQDSITNLYFYFRET